MEARMSGPERPVPSVSFRAAVKIWARIALLSFGGPAGQIAVMHRILVDEKKWIDEARFLHALNYCMLLPGPEAQQLATYIGWLLHGVRGGLAAGLLFIFPGFIAILGLSALYAVFHQAALLQAIFFGIKAGVLAIVIEAVVRIGRRALKSGAHHLIAIAAFLALFLFGTPFPLVILAAAFAGFAAQRLSRGDGAGQAHAPAGYSRPPLAHVIRTLGIWGGLWLVPVALLLWLRGQGDVFTEIAVFFSKMAVVTFGGAYAVLAYVGQQAVENFGWLRPGEMLDGLGMAETTPGPLILVVQFVAFMAAWRDPGGLDPLLAGVLASIVGVWVTFTPCFLWIFLGAPYVERLRHLSGLNAALSGVTAAVVGVILNLGLWLGVHVLFARVGRFDGMGLHVTLPDPSSLSWPALAIFVLALVAVLRLKTGVAVVVGGSALAGMALRLVV